MGAKGKHKPAPGAVRPDKVLHPQSRKVAKLHKKENRKFKVNNSVTVGAKRLEVLGEKLQWFHDNLAMATDTADDVTVLTGPMMLRLVEAYMERFEEEVEQIQIKNSVGKHKNNHRSRMDAIKHVKECEKRDFENGHMELPDLTDPENFKYFHRWNGELRFVQNIKIKKFSRKSLGQSDDDEIKTPDSATKESEDMDTNV